MATTLKPSPRWLYALHAFIQRLPVPGWLLGVLISVVAAILLHLEAWRLGVLPSGTLSGYLLTAGNYPIVLYAAWFFLNDQARRVLTSFFKHSNKAEAKLEIALTDFLSLPEWLAAAALLVGLVFGYFNYQLALSLSPVAGRVFPPYDLIGFLLVGGWFGLMFTRAVRQALLIRGIYAEVKVNIFNPAPLNTLSRYSSQSSLALVLLNYLVILVSLPQFLTSTNGYIVSVLLISTVIFFFFVSVGGIHQRLRDEKDRLLSELGAGLNKETTRLVRATRTGSYAKMAEISSTIGAHKESLELVRKISTWPWEPETVRNLLLPLLFPVIVYLVQRYLGALIGG